MNTTSTIVPHNYQGKATDLTFSVELPSLDAALDSFRRAAKRLLNPPLWHELGGWASAHFAVVDEMRQPLQRPIREGDYLRIDVPGPGPRIGDGYDWVRVEIIEDKTQGVAEEEWLGLQVRPCNEPGRPAQPVAHFFRAEATSTFFVKRKGRTVFCSYHGRNEKPNADTEVAVDNVRNAIMAAGAIASLSETQWSALCKGVLAD